MQPPRSLLQRAARPCFWAAPALFFWICEWRVSHHCSLKSLAVFAGMCGGLFAYGRLFLRVAPAPFKAAGGPVIQFLCGYLVFNTLLFLLLLAAPFGIRVDACLLAVPGLGALFVRPGEGEVPDGALPGALCVLLCAAAAMLWCGDALNPEVKEGGNTVFQLWPDSFFHARQISIFAGSHGLATISDMRQAGVPAPVYHYASYALPAAVCAFTGSSAYDVFASFQLPLGVLLSGLAAFALAAAIWGEWPGVAAAAAVLLLPDAYQQGFANKFLSYAFMQQIGTGGLYGVACIAVAWMFLLPGCRNGQLAAVAVGYAFTLLAVAYKAHLFVANAFLVMIYPCIFLKRPDARWRLLAGLGLVAAFLSAAAFSQRFESIPLLRLDGSSIHEYAGILAMLYDPGALKAFFGRELTSAKGWALPFFTATAILLSTFGLWLAACPAAAFFARKKAGAAALFLPFFVVANYLVMSLGLAMDTKNIALHEELVHRPFVWAYFLVAAWTGGAAYAVFFGDRLPGTVLGRCIAGGMLLAGLAVPATFAHNLQTMPAWPEWASFRTMDSVPSSLVKACAYLRKHAGPRDVVQDSENDSRLVVTALSERQDFASRPAKTPAKMTPELTRRLDGLANFRKLPDEAALMAFARDNGIAWYLLEPSSSVAWPAAFLDAPEYRSGKYRVYRLSASPMVSVTK